MTIHKAVVLAQLVLLQALLLPVAAMAAQAGKAEERIRNLFELRLKDPRVKVEVQALPENRFAVYLLGEVASDQERDDLVSLARKIRPSEVEIVSRLGVSRPRPEEATRVWPLTYIRSRVSLTGTDAGRAEGRPDHIDVLVESLQRIYGPASVQRAGSNRLILRGPRATLAEIERVLVVADAPWPQVQMNMWAIQVSGSATEIADNVRKIAGLVRETHSDMASLQRYLAEIATDEKEDRENVEYLAGQFEAAGIDLNQEGPLSLNEALLLLILRPNRLPKVGLLQKFVKGQRGDERPVFRHLESVLARESCHEDWWGFIELATALSCFNAGAGGPGRPDVPLQLARAGARVDRLLKGVMDAFAEDMNEIYLEPLLEDIKELSPPKRNRGVTLVGRTRIVVTSGLEARLAPEMSFFVETTRPRPFGRELLDLAFPASESGADGTAAEDLTGAAGVLAGLPEAQAALLAAALLGEPEPTYSTVAPGISIGVRPTVLPDGGSARLTIDARFGVASQPLNAPQGGDAWAQRPADGIVSHNVRTDAAVSAFDLFEISSFSVTSSHPQSPVYIPILGRLPWIGRAFQIPRGNKEVRFESMILVNTVILPRALQLYQFYDTSASAGDGRACREPAAPSAPCEPLSREGEELRTAQPRALR